MSVGVGVGDFIKILELVIQTRKRFVDAPRKYDEISQDLRSFSTVIQDIDILLSGQEPDISDQESLKDIAHKSTALVNDISSRLDMYQEIAASSPTVARWARKAIKRVNWDQAEVQDFRGRISLHLELLNSFERQLSSKKISRIEQGVHKLREKSDEQERDAILNWIGKFDHGSHQSVLFDRHVEGTGEWFINCEEFQKWSKTEGGILFCPGLPGAGKTILASIAIQHLSNLSGHDKYTTVAYYYCGLQQEGETVNAILSTILKKLAQCSGSLPDAISTLYHKYKDMSIRPSPEEISNALMTLASLYSRCFIVIDGLDECPVWKDVIGKLKCLPEANLLATSREYPDIANDPRLEGSIRLEVRAMDTDVRKYLDRNMGKLHVVVKDDQQLLEDICNSILDASGGMFLLAHLHLESLSGKMSVKSLKKAVSDLSTGASAYDKVYDDIMKRIESQSEEEATAAKDVLAWLTFAKRPLKVEEFSIAVSLEETDSYLDKESLKDFERLVSVCRGLVVVDTQNGTVTLIHATTKEYLKCRLWNWRQDPNVAIATSCLTYLMFPTFDIEFSNLEEYLKREKAGAQLYPLLEYSLDYPALHVRSAMGKPPSFDRYFSSGSKITKNWLLLISKRGDEHGESVAEWLIQQGVCTKVCDPQGRTPLHHAVLNGWKRCVKLLLERGAILSADIDNMTPLHYTVKTDAEDIALAFINAGVPVNTSVTRQAYRPSNYYGRVAYDIKDSEKLLGQNSHTKVGLTSLHLAALTGSQRMTKFFLDHGANPNFTSTSGETPLHLAMRQTIYDPQKPGIVDFWNEPDNRLECIFDYIDLHDDDDDEDYGWVWERRLAIIDLLLESPEVDVNAQDHHGISPVHIAARKKSLSEAVFQKLIEKGANISLRTAKNETLLHVAITNLNDGAVSKLLALGADPADKDDNGHNALHKAARKGHFPIVQDILTWTPKSSLQAILESKDHHGQNVFHHLLGSRGPVSVDLTAYLLERASGINDLDMEGMTPVALFLSKHARCAHQSDPDILDHVFRNGADPSFVTAGGLNLGHLVAGSPRVSDGLLRTLARWGVSLTSKDERGRTALHHACIEGSLTKDVLCFLHEEVELPMDIRDEHGKIALDYAIEKGKEYHDPDFFKPGRWKKTERLLRGMEKEV